MDLYDEFLSLNGLEQLGLNDALIREAHDPKHPDMSPEAIEQGLREVRRLYKLGLALRNPTWVWRGDITEAQATRQRKDSSE